MPLATVTHGSARTIRFLHRNRLVEVHDATPTRTVLDWLREDARCTGTKEGCNEGDCGACTVMIAELAPATADASPAKADSAVPPVIDAVPPVIDLQAPALSAAVGPKDVAGGLQLRTVNACIQFLPTLDGKALFSVEDLKAISAGRLHPVQQAMVDCHGSQCGFCTPGFVMTLWHAYETARIAQRQPTRLQLADSLSGNLCRCTGYRPILDAGQRMFELPEVALDTQGIVDALRSIQRNDEIVRHDPGPAATGGTLYAPKTLTALADLRLALPEATLLAGSTDIGLWVNKQHRALGDLIFVGDVAGFKHIDVDAAQTRIGAGASLEAAWAQLAAQVPELTDVWRRFASPPIRHAGTMGGNVANGSPIGDSAPVLLALDAAVDLRRGSRLRRLPLSAFYLDYMKNQLEPGEFIEAIVVPAAATQRRIRAYKISKRFDCDISALCAAFAIELDDDRVASVRMAFGGMAAVVRRATRTEACLIGRAWDEQAVADAQAALAEDFAPLTDLRASAGHRLRVARNLIARFWHETRVRGALPQTAVNAFCVMPDEEPIS